MGLFDRDVYGEAALLEAVEGVDFPASTYQIMEQVGERNVQWFKEGDSLELKEIVGKLDYQIFESPSQLLEAVVRDITVI